MYQSGHHRLKFTSEFFVWAYTVHTTNSRCQSNISVNRSRTPAQTTRWTFCFICVSVPGEMSHWLIQKCYCSPGLAANTNCKHALQNIVEHPFFLSSQEITSRASLNMNQLRVILQFVQRPKTYRTCKIIFLSLRRNYEFERKTI